MSAPLFMAMMLTMIYNMVDSVPLQLYYGNSHCDIHDRHNLLMNCEYFQSFDRFFLQSHLFLQDVRACKIRKSKILYASIRF